MATQFPGLALSHRSFIGQQPIFFAATTAPNARINLSPKGMDSLRVLSPTRILSMNLTGSGNETAAHLTLDPDVVQLLHPPPDPALTAPSAPPIPATPIGPTLPLTCPTNPARAKSTT